MMCCNCLDNVAISLLIIATNGLWSVMMHTSLANGNVGTSLAHVVYEGLSFYTAVASLST